MPKTDPVLNECKCDACSIFATPVGALLALVSNHQLIRLSYYRADFRADFTDDGGDTRNGEILCAVKAQVEEYFARSRTHFDLPLNLRGPVFHRRVWQELCNVPYGHTISYGQLASRVGAPGSARAVGAANGANPVVIVVPCHRVIGSDGRLVGYGGGLERKRTLLDLEGDPELLIR